ncbi:MAG TPA: hypothetical protein VNV86_08370 [Candidatus Acidoferrum sp.]|nr:hypothetical protein [Candidatus Acidoferrum sp.]
MNREVRIAALLSVSLFVPVVPAQGGGAEQQPMQMPGMQMPGMNHGMQMNEAGMYLMNMATGTSMNPLSWPMPMLMPRLGSWNLMVMGEAFLVETQQAAPRGGDKFYSPNTFMLSALHSLAGGSFMFQSMFSLEAATVTNRSYPLLFQTGETAFGRPLVDAQHPHNFFMGLGLQYAHPLGENTMLQFYYAPVGDPALGPVAYPHRASAQELPQAPLGHHWQDSTHIADNVATVAIKHRWLRLEASGFFGSEPGENRWIIQWGPMNSYSGRFSVFPSKNWMFQVSAGHLTRPERQAPGDVTRTTASLHYTRPMGFGNAWSTSLIWGRNHDTFTQHNVNSYLAETVYPISRKNFLTGRIEYVDKDELFANTPDLEEQLDRTAGSSFRIGSFIAGYTRDIGTFKDIETGIGANATVYTLPSAIKPFYGDRPWGVNIYLRLRLKPNQP